MKTRAVLLSALLLAPAARAAITLQFSGGTTRASNWESQSDRPQMVWGILVDTSHNGFLPNSYLPGFSYADAVDGVFLERNAAVTDDLLFLSINLMSVTSSATDGNSAGTNFITSLSIFTHLSEISGAPFRIIWFDHHTHPTLSGDAGITAFGLLDIPGAILPNDGDPPAIFTSFFTGTDPLRPQEYYLQMPEPSHALLGLCGLALLLPRRRAVGGGIA